MAPRSFTCRPIHPVASPLPRSEGGLVLRVVTGWVLHVA